LLSRKLTTQTVFLNNDAPFYTTFYECLKIATDYLIRQWEANECEGGKILR
jgi:hypothetical protein